MYFFVVEVVFGKFAMFAIVIINVRNLTLCSYQETANFQPEEH